MYLNYTRELTKSYLVVGRVFQENKSFKFIYFKKAIILLYKVDLKMNTKVANLLVWLLCYNDI